ncbi:uncharacterized protein LOC125656542 [Ostrea edulis]|uniref:uncharacterized protein LOC125656542 n=1 Tax=Ostrea edulis TaxID=37623 RepID=UPI0024AF7E93|nr:uncharacterized protein LOC125656542 [Ostrea edulis]
MTGESSIPIGDVLRPKITRRVGCWNVRTLYQTGKLAQVVREMEHYKIELLGVSEARWTGSGSKQLVSGHQILYSGRTDDHHCKGVAIITTKEVHRSLLEWKPVSERIITARYNSAFAKLTAVVCYAPIDDGEDEEKISFYDSLQNVVDDTPSHDVLLILGDLNAKVGKCNQDKTWKIVEERKEKKIKSCPQNPRGKRTNSRQNIGVKRSARADRKAYTEKLAYEAEQAASKQDMQTLYRITKTLAGKFQSSELPIKDKQGNVLSKEEIILKCWKEHFEEVFNMKDPENEAIIIPATDTLDIDTDPPSIEEVKKAITKLKTGKAAGIDQIHAELLKAKEYWTPTILTNILQMIWESEETPSFWKTGLIVKLPKK